MIPFSLTKRTLVLLVCSGSILAIPSVAQTDTPPPSPGQTQGSPTGYNGPRRGGPDQRAEMLARQLNLSPDQTTQVKALLETERSKMEAVRSNTALSRDDIRTQMMTIHQDNDVKLRSLLTADQATKFDAMQARQRARMQEHQDGQGAPPAPPAGAPQR